MYRSFPVTSTNQEFPVTSSYQLYGHSYMYPTFPVTSSNQGFPVNSSNQGYGNNATPYPLTNNNEENGYGNIETIRFE